MCFLNVIKSFKGISSVESQACSILTRDNAIYVKPREMSLSLVSTTAFTSVKSWDYWINQYSINHLLWELFSCTFCGSNIGYKIFVTGDIGTHPLALKIGPV